ncbi:uncharacterized protein LOC144135161 [Amblyomma americanum]
MYFQRFPTAPEDNAAANALSRAANRATGRGIAPPLPSAGSGPFVRPFRTSAGGGSYPLLVQPTIAGGPHPQVLQPGGALVGPSAVPGLYGPVPLDEPPPSPSGRPYPLPVQPAAAIGPYLLQVQPIASGGPYLQPAHSTAAGIIYPQPIQRGAIGIDPAQRFYGPPTPIAPLPQPAKTPAVDVPVPYDVAATLEPVVPELETPTGVSSSRRSQKTRPDWVFCLAVTLAMLLLILVAVVYYILRMHRQRERSFMDKRQ